MSASSGVLRLTKEYKIIATRTTFDNYVAVPDPKNIFEWHFIIFGLKDSDYEHGFYHGKISFPPEYPLKPPSLRFFTPSGRFEIDK
jgi:ubiquitin-protein ligase